MDETAVLLSVYLDPLLTDRRVLCIGSVPSPAVARMARVARSLRVLSTSRETSRGSRDVKVSAYRPGPLGFSRDAFDVLLVPDLDALGDDALDRLDDFARIAGDGGVLVVSDSSIEEERDYERFYDCLAERFAVVRMLGVAPFAGATVAELGEHGASDVVVDGSLVEVARRPSRYVAVCAQLDVRLDPIVVVETERAEAAPSNVADLEGRIETLDVRIGELREELAIERDEGSRLRAALEDERAELERLESEARRATRDFGEARTRASDLEKELKRLRKAAEEATDAGDFRELEGRLAEQADEVRDLAAEVERRGTLVRELVEENLELRARRAPAEDPRVLERALRAEAERAEAHFANDELRSRIAELASETDDGRKIREAELAGRVRGLAARMAELEELRGLAEARLAIAEMDLATGRERERRLLADKERMREDLELELVRAHGPQPIASTVEAAALRASERELAERVGQLTGQLVLAREKELDARAQRDVARGESLAFVAQVSALETQLHEHKRRVLAELTAAVDATRAIGAGDVESTIEGNLRRLIATSDALRGERDGLRLRLEARERHAVQATAPTDLLDELDRLRAEVEALRGETSTLRVDLADLSDTARRDADRAADLTSAVAARDALVTRLQMDLAEAEQHGRVLRDRAQHLANEGERLREAVLHGASAAEDKDELARRVGVLEAEIAAATRQRDETASSLGRVRDELVARVADLAAEVEQERARSASAVERQEADARALADTRAILEDLRARSSAAASSRPRAGLETGDDVGAPRAASEPDGRDTVIRSLTAQLEERDDRLRALERRLGGQLGAASDEALRRELLELKERSLRLGEELGVERAARRLAEERSAQLASLAAVEGEVRALERKLATRERDVDAERERAEDLARDVRMLRDAFADARSGLEALFGSASASGDPELAERVGALLTSLSRY